LTSANMNQNAQAEKIADGMSRLTAWKLATTAERVQTDGSEIRCTWNSGTTVDVIIQDQSGLADLNAMPPMFFEEFFQKLGAPRNVAKSLSLAMIDYRDVDSQSENGSTELVTYPGHNFGPKNGPFQAIEEIDQLPGMDGDLYRKVLPLVTVHSSQPGIDPVSAPKQLRRLFNESTETAFTGTLAPYQGATQGKAFGIDVRVTGKSGSRFRRKSVAVILQQPDKPFVFLEWQRGNEWEETPITRVVPCLN
jgi:general secretion pathway protein K